MIEGNDTEVNQLSLRPKLSRWVNDTFEIIRQKKDMLRLSSRKKVSAAGALFVLLDLQLAATKHYFTIDYQSAAGDFRVREAGAVPRRDMHVQSDRGPAPYRCLSEESRTEGPD